MKTYEKYKDPKVAWLGQVPEHWGRERIKHCFDERVQKGYPDEPLLSATQSHGVIPQSLYANRVVSAQKDLHLLKLVEKGDFVISLRSFQGGIEFAYYRGIISPAYTVMAPKTITDGYFRYLAKSADFIGLLQTCVTGIREGQNIDYRILKNKRIPIPLPAEQEQIVRYLDWKVAMADKFVREKHHQIELLKEQIEALCYGGSNNEHTVITQWCPNLPSHWKSVLAKRIFVERKVKNCSEEEMLAVTQDRGVVFKKDCSQNYVTAENTSTQKLVKRDDFVISLRSFQGGIEYSKVQGIVSPAYNVFYLKEKYNSPELQAYYRFLFKSKAFIALLFSMGGGIRDGKNISFSDFSQIELPLPSKDVSEEILRLSQIYDSLSDYLPQTIKFINEYKTSLISDVTTGKVDIRGIEIPDYEKEELTTIEEDNEDNNE